MTLMDANNTTPSAGSALTREEWLARCAARFVEKANAPEQLARDMAESQLENLKDDLTENPEEAADDEMLYWTED